MFLPIMSATTRHDNWIYAVRNFNLILSLRTLLIIEVYKMIA